MLRKLDNHIKNNEIDLYLTLVTEIYLKWIKNLQGLKLNIPRTK